MFQKKKILLVEMAVVAAVLLVLVVIMLPTFLQSQVRAKLAFTYQRLNNIIQANQAYKADIGEYASYPHGFWKLTTPIVYLNDWKGIEDPFEENILDENGQDISNPGHFFWWLDFRIKTASKEGMQFYYHNTPQGLTEYIIGSNGPSHQRPYIKMTFSNNESTFIGGYHSSNGLISVGMIVATDKQVIQDK